MATSYSTRAASPSDYPPPPSPLSVIEEEDDEDEEEPSRFEDHPKKKRKAWGQPVPEIVPILPPRKRAKTAEEKEQRKNERILRNRRAADKSRQRQKAAQAELEQQNKTLIAENAQLKELLRQHGLLSGFHFNHPTPPPSVTMSPPSPYDLENMKHENSPPPAYEPESNDKSSATPVLSAGTPAPSYYQESPALAPILNLGESATQTTSVPNSVLTQYPAVVLCDLQCQPETLDQKLRSLQPNQMVNTVLTFLHCLTILKNFSTSMLSPMSQIFQILAETLSVTSTQLESIVSNNFQLIHILISMPMTSTRPAVFRLKLLSRLLASNPSLAPLLLTAADRALQPKVNEEHWTDNPDHRWAWASLMTIKWSIQWLEKEHRVIRMQLRNGSVDKDQLLKLETDNGVDYGAVERHYKLFDLVDSSPRIQGSPPSKTDALTASVKVY